MDTFYIYLPTIFMKANEFYSKLNDFRIFKNNSILKGFILSNLGAQPTSVVSAKDFFNMYIINISESHDLNKYWKQF